MTGDLDQSKAASADEQLDSSSPQLLHPDFVEYLTVEGVRKMRTRPLLRSSFAGPLQSE